MWHDDRETGRDVDFLREAEEEGEKDGQEQRPNEDGMVRDRQAAQQRERLRDARENVSDLPDDEPGA